MRNLHVAVATASAVIASTVLVAAPASAADVAFEDGLRQCVNLALGHGANDAISETDAASVVTLDCQDGTFTALTGVQSLTALTTLDISGGAVTDLRPLRGLPALTSVRAENMHVTLPAAPVGSTVATIVFSPDPAANPVAVHPQPGGVVTVDDDTSDWTFNGPFVAGVGNPTVWWDTHGFVHPENPIDYYFSGTIHQDGVYLAPTVTDAPADVTVEEGQPAVFTANATSNDPGMTVRWQTSADGGGRWDDVADATSTTWTIAPTTLAHDGWLVRAVFTSAGGETPSASATLTVTPLPGPPVVVRNPDDVTVPEGQPATFGAEATSTVPGMTGQWQTSTDGTTWTDVPGATGTTWTIPATTRDQNGLLVRERFTNAEGTVDSGTARLTVTTAPVVVADPVDRMVVEGRPVTFSAEATSADVPGMTVRWQTSTDGVTWTDLADATDTTLTIADPTRDQSRSRVRAVFTNAVGSTVTASAVLTVLPAEPGMLDGPTDQTTTEGGDVEFIADISSPVGDEPEFTWEYSTDGGATWQVVRLDDEGAVADTLAAAAEGEATGADEAAIEAEAAMVDDAADAAGEPAADDITDLLDFYTVFLTIENVGLELDGARFRVLVSNEAGWIRSGEATLTVSAAPVDPAPSPSAAPTSSASPRTLAATGTSLAPLAVGAGAFVLGLGLVVLRRRQTA